MTPEIRHNSNNGFLVERNNHRKLVLGRALLPNSNQLKIDVCRASSAVSHCLWAWAVHKYHLGWWSFVENVKVVLSAKGMHTAELAQVSNPQPVACVFVVLQAGFRASASYPFPSVSQLREIWGCFSKLGLLVLLLHVYLCIAIQISIRHRADESFTGSN